MSMVIVHRKVRLKSVPYTVHITRTDRAAWAFRLDQPEGNFFACTTYNGPTAYANLLMWIDKVIHDEADIRRDSTLSKEDQRLISDALYALEKVLMQSVMLLWSSVRLTSGARLRMTLVGSGFFDLSFTMSYRSTHGSTVCRYQGFLLKDAFLKWLREEIRFQYGEDYTEITELDYFTFLYDKVMKKFKAFLDARKPKKEEKK